MHTLGFQDISALLEILKLVCMLLGIISSVGSYNNAPCVIRPLQSVVILSNSDKGRG